jgi:hypothetical protein
MLSSAEYLSQLPWPAMAVTNSGELFLNRSLKETLGVEQASL